LAVILAGSEELYELAAKDFSPLRNVCHDIYLADIEEDKSIELVAQGLRSSGIASPAAEELGRCVFMHTKGHPYLTQRIGAMLEDDFRTGISVPPERVAQVVERLSREHSYSQYVAKAIRERNLGSACRNVMRGDVNFSRIDEEMARLEILGLIKNVDGRWALRNPFFEKLVIQAEEPSRPPRDPSNRTITWLHLSDLHFCNPQTGWHAKNILYQLVNDLEHMEKVHNLRPDILFFTGDLTYGEIGKRKGLRLRDQFDEARDFLREVQNRCQIANERVFLVPGNHDTNIKEVRQEFSEYLDKQQDDKYVTDLFNTPGKIAAYMIRLNEYRSFLEKYGFSHLLRRGRCDFLFAEIVEINGVRIGIGGFNSAWSSSGIGDKEKGKLWLAANYQLNTIRNDLRDAAFSIALMHHPSHWLSARERANDFMHDVEETFRFLLHGHEHESWVDEKANDRNGHAIISAGACYQGSEKPSGYNFVRCDFEANRIEVWLRTCNVTSHGWIPLVIRGKTDNNGMMLLKSTSWMRSVARTSG
jgi:3',5'-cyclic AMP phosphodiesterase CpdA